MNLNEFVLQISTQEKSISDLLIAPPESNLPVTNLHHEQRKDPKLAMFFDIFLQDEKGTRKSAALATNLDKVLYFVDHKKTAK